MELFENETINIERIVSVAKYVASEENLPRNIKYSTALHTYELVFFVSGGGEAHFGGVDMIDAPGSMRYLPKGKSAGEYTVKIVNPGYCIDIYFDTKDEMPTRAIGFSEMDFLGDKFIKLYHIWKEKKVGYYANAMSVFYEIISAMQVYEKRYLASEQRERLDRAYEYIRKNYRSVKFDYRALCHTCGIRSYSYFCDIFTAKYHMTPSKLVTKFKIDDAKELLITQSYSITKIAECCGFENMYYFSSVFKRVVGQSPKQYREAIKNG